MTYYDKYLKYKTKYLALKQTGGSNEIIEISLRKIYVDAIKNGSKTIEGRINSGFFKTLKSGQTVKFFSKEGNVTCKIVKIAFYKSFKEMLETEGFKNCIPEVNSLEDAVKIYDSIPGYSFKANKFGVLAIHLEKIN
jgi:ASC-1-like (ASCH) protein